jgi:uncharacterized protein YgiM (DUF1202 family)
LRNDLPREKIIETKENKKTKREDDEVNIEDSKSVLGIKSEIQNIEIIATPSAVNLRSGPSTSTKILKSITTNVKAKKINESPGWVQVEIETEDKLIKGWVNDQYVISK